MKINNYFSPNFEKRVRPKSHIKVIVIHYTGMQSERESLVRLCSHESKVSSHYLINRNGKVYKLVKEENVAWHAGVSYWQRFKNLNKYSIGIELVNKGHEFGYTNFNRQQIESLIKICKKLIKRYKINKINIVGHSDIAPNRKKDPGEKFPWKKLADQKIGIWHDHKMEFLKKFRNIKILKKKDHVKFLKNLKKIGFYFSFRNKALLAKTISAFQRRFRKELINGVADLECLIITESLAKKL